MQQPVSDCVPCVFRIPWDPYLEYPIKGYCSHTKSRYSLRPTFKFSKFCEIVLYLSLIPILLAAFSCTNQLLVLFKSDRLLFLLVFADQVYLVNTTITAFIICIQFSTQFREMRAWNEIIINRRFFGMKHILDEVNTKKLHKYRKYSTVAIYFYILFETTMRYLFVYDYFRWSNMRLFCLIYCSLVQTLSCFEFCYRIMMQANTLTALRNSLISEKLSEKLVARYIRFAMVLHRNLIMILEFIKYFISLWIFTTTISLILNIFILVRYKDSNVGVFLLQLRTFSSIVSLIFMLVVHDNQLRNKVSFLA